MSFKTKLLGCLSVGVTKKKQFWTEYAQEYEDWMKKKPAELDAKGNKKKKEEEK